MCKRLMSLLALAILAVITYQVQAYVPVYDGKRINSNILILAELNNPEISKPDVHSLSAWNDFLQKHFLRPSKLDHHDMAHSNKDSNFDRMRPYFVALDMIGDMQAAKRKYNQVFVFGGTPEFTKKRFQYLAENLTNKSYKFSNKPKVTYINGRRKLAKLERDEAKAYGLECEYQHQCAELLWNKFNKDLDVEFEIMTLEPPTNRRINTEDTLQAYFAILPRATKEGRKTRVLGYSSQPYVPYQYDTALAVAKAQGRDDLEIEVIGPANDELSYSLAYLDSIARRVYTVLNSN